MAHVSDSALEEMTQGEIIMQMMSLLKVLGKKEKASSKELEKLETKKEKSAPPKGVRPVQLDKSTAWVEFVHHHMLRTGWESFIHAEKFGKGMADVQYRESMLTPLLGDDGKQEIDEDGDVGYAHVFAGSVTKSDPNGDQPNMSHAMTVSKMYWSPAKKTGSKPELYQEFEAQYVPPPPAEGDAPVSHKKVVSRVSMTVEEKRIAKEQKEAEKEAEKERKKKEREAERERKVKEKEAEKQAKLAAKVPKGVVKSKVPVSVKAPIPATKSSSSSSAAPKSVLKPSAIAAKPKQVAEEDWVPPEKGRIKELIVKGVKYLCDYQNMVWKINENGDPEEGGCVGVYIPATRSIDDQHPLLPDDDEEDK